MKSEISKARLRGVVTREKKATATAEPRSFRNGNFLASLYIAILATVAVIAMLWAYPRSLWSIRLPSGIVITFVALLGSRMMFGLIAQDMLKRNSRILMLCFVCIFSIILSAMCLVITTNPHIQDLFGFDLTKACPFLFPYLLAPALATLLVSPAAGISLGVGTMILNMLFVENTSVLPALAIGVVTSVITTEVVGKVRKRTALLRAFVLAGGMQFLGVLIYLTMEMALGKDSESLAEATLVSAVSSIISTVFSFGFTVILLPILEHIFAACSNIRLNEFSDLGSPLLQRLSLEAPGTYHHSIVVANLAAAAADRIGANALLARVGSYYHDIGKLSKPSFYTENIGAGQQSPHQNISPNMSTVIIAAHVKEGIGISLHYNLPPPILDIIREHHGTGIMSWFLHKAKEEAKAKAAETKSDPQPVDESQFRYPGPRPSTREAGIVLLADSVEAASRSLEKPVPTLIENLVDQIVKTKIDDEQLDCCPLSFIDVAIIKRTFTSTLSNILHARIAYPKDDDSKEAPHDADNRNSPAESPR